MFQNHTKTGRTGSTQKFVRVLQKTKAYSWETQDKNDKLIAGAVQAFKEGRPQNIQAALSNARSIENWHHHDIVASILFKVTEKRTDKSAVLELALKNVSEKDRNTLLNKALNRAIESHIGGEAFYALLIKAGGNANASIDGYAETPLVTATVVKSPFPVIKLLHDNGANIDEAITTMHSQGRGSVEINRLEHYKKKLVVNKQPAPVDAEEAEDIRESLREIKQQLRDLTDAFNALQASQSPASLDETPASRRKPGQKSPYPSVG